MLEPLASA